MRENLDIGRVVSGVFQTYAKQAAVLIPAALIVFIPIAILSGLILAAQGGIILFLLVSILGFIGTYLFQGMVIRLVQDLQDGRRDSTAGQLVQSVVPVLGALIVVSILEAVGVGIGLILIIVPGLILLTIWAVVAPVVVVEQPGVMAAFGRSRELVRGNGWQVFGVLVLFFILQFIVNRIITGIVIGVSASLVGYAVAALIVNVLMAPLTALAAATMYFQLRAIKEGAAAVAPGAAAPAVSGGTAPAAPTAPAPGAPPSQAPQAPPPQAPPSQPPPAAS